jgi:hypothetical protein
LSGNILRCFEAGSGEWLWILGDDDRIEPHAVNTILETIRESADCTFVNFSSPIKTRSSELVTTGVDEFAGRMDSFSNILFLSAGIYKSEHVRHNVRFGYQYAGTLCPHLAILLKSIGSNGRCRLSAKTIVGWEGNARGDGWSLLDLSIGFPSLLEMPFSYVSKRHMAQSAALALPSVDGFFRSFVVRARNSDEYKSARFIFDELCVRRSRFESKLRVRIVLCLQRLLFMLPFSVMRVLVSGKAKLRLLTSRRMQAQTNGIE